MTLAELQRLFGGVLLDAADPSALAQHALSDERADAKTRVAIYTDMVRLRLLEVLGELYPRTRTYLGDRWDDVAHAYVRAHPSRAPSLRAYGARFAEGLDPDVASLARLEWLRYDLFDAVDEPILRGEQMATLAPDALLSLPLTRVAASALLEIPVDADALWHERASEGPATLLVWRDGITLYHRRLDAKEAGWVAQLDGSLTLGLLCERFAPEMPIEEAAQATFAQVGRWIADGLLRAPA